MKRIRPPLRAGFGRDVFLRQDHAVYGPWQADAGTLTAARIMQAVRMNYFIPKNHSYRMGCLAVLLSIIAAFTCHWLYRSYSSFQKSAQYRPSRWVSLREPAKIPEPAERDRPKIPELRLAIAPVLSPEMSIGLYKHLVNYLGMQLNRRGVLLQRDTYAAVNDLVRYARCDFAFVCTYAYIRGEQEFGMKILAIPEVAGATTYHSYILTSSRAHIDSILDLRGKRFASADIMSTSGWLYPALWLLDHGENPDRFFSDHIFTGSHDCSIHAVIAGYMDGAAVDSLVYQHMLKENPSISKKLTIIQKSPPFGIPPIVVRPSIDPSMESELLSLLLDMHKHPEGRRILKILAIDRFVPPLPGLYDSVRDAVRRWEGRSP